MWNFCGPTPLQALTTKQFSLTANCRCKKGDLVQKQHYLVVLVLILAFASSASASIKFTAVNKVIPNGSSLPIDFNHDGSNEFSIASSFNFPFCGRAFSFVPQGSASISPFHLSSGTVLANGYAAAFPSAVSIGPRRTYKLSATLLERVAECSGLRPEGNWWNVSHRFIGVAFVLAGQVHYGWIELSMIVKNLKVTTTVVAFAYETTPGKPIITGQTGIAANQ